MTRERWRVVQLAVGPEGRPDTLGSGYLVGSDVVLTADHVVRDRAPEECSVRFPAADAHIPPVKVVKIISGARVGCDLAVLIIQEFRGSVFPNPVSFGRLVDGRVDELPAVSLGYPRWKRRTIDDGRRRTARTIADMRGRLKLVTLDGRGGLEFVLDDALPELDDAGPWGAMSGSPVWVGNRLVAVVIEHHPAEGAGRLVVQPIQDLLRLVGDDRKEAVAALGMPDLLDKLQMATGDHFVGANSLLLDPTGRIRYTLESTTLPRKALVTGTRYTIGRRQSNDVVIDRAGVGGLHCRIWVVWDGTPAGYVAYIQDEQSTNGTTVNGMGLSAYDPYRLADGDEITLGMVATFHLRRVTLR